MVSKVERYMSSPVISVYASDNVARARNLMLRHKISRLVVIDSSGKPVGIISRSDIIRFFLNKKKAVRPLEEVLVEEIMSKPLITIPPSASLKKASEIMLKKNISSLPVVSVEKGLIGILTATDLVRAFRDLGSGKARVLDYMRRDPLRVSRGHSIFYVIELMKADPDRKIIVVEDQKPIGIITESDLAFIEPRSISESRESYIKKKGYTARGFIGVVRDYIIPTAEDLMTPNPITITEEEDLSKASDTMIRNKISSLPVVDSGGNLTGLISKRGVLKAIIDLL
ncbi:MAG: CBS domain-containing protein [Sulfolobales archaeon]